MRQNLKEENIKLESEKFWVFAISNAAYYFFYLDDGDNPPVYIIDFDYTDEPDYEDPRKIGNSFSAFINEFIENFDFAYSKP